EKLTVGVGDDSDDGDEDAPPVVEKTFGDDGDDGDDDAPPVAEKTSLLAIEKGEGLKREEKVEKGEEPKLETAEEVFIRQVEKVEEPKLETAEEEFIRKQSGAQSTVCPECGASFSSEIACERHRARGCAPTPGTP
ncbi:hypothetical protein T484DRAFT_1817883, partial [Baffinella frigidus]